MKIATWNVNGLRARIDYLQLWLEQRQPEKAIPYLEKASRDGSTAAQARAALGRAYLDSGEAGRAVPHLEAGLETDEDGSLHFQLARAYQANGQAELAREIDGEHAAHAARCARVGNDGLPSTVADRPLDLQRTPRHVSLGRGKRGLRVGVFDPAVDEQVDLATRCEAGA